MFDIILKYFYHFQAVSQLLTLTFAIFFCKPSPAYAICCSICEVFASQGLPVRAFFVANKVAAVFVCKANLSNQTVDLGAGKAKW